MLLIEQGRVGLADAESLVGQDARVRRLAVDLVANGKCKRLRSALALMAPTEDVAHVTSDQFKAGQAEIRAEIAELRAEQRIQIAEVQTEIANLDTRLSTQIAGVRTEIASLETRLIRWMVSTRTRK